MEYLYETINTIVFSMIIFLISIGGFVVEVRESGKNMHTFYFGAYFLLTAISSVFLIIAMNTFLKWYWCLLIFIPSAIWLSHFANLLYSWLFSFKLEPIYVFSKKKVILPKVNIVDSLILAILGIALLYQIDVLITIVCIVLLFFVIRNIWLIYRKRQYIRATFKPEVWKERW